MRVIRVILSDVTDSHQLKIRIIIYFIFKTSWQLNRLILMNEVKSIRPTNSL